MIVRRALTTASNNQPLNLLFPCMMFVSLIDIMVIFHTVLVTHLLTLTLHGTSSFYVRASSLNLPFDLSLFLFSRTWRCTPGLRRTGPWRCPWPQRCSRRVASVGLLLPPPRKGSLGLTVLIWRSGSRKGRLLTSSLRTAPQLYIPCISMGESNPDSVKASFMARLRLSKTLRL